MSKSMFSTLWMSAYTFSAIYAGKMHLLFYSEFRLLHEAEHVLLVLFHSDSLFPYNYCRKHCAIYLYHTILYHTFGHVVFLCYRKAGRSIRLPLFTSHVFHATSCHFLCFFSFFSHLDLHSSTSTSSSTCNDSLEVPIHR